MLLHLLFQERGSLQEPVLHSGAFRKEDVGGLWRGQRDTEIVILLTMKWLTRGCILLFFVDPSLQNLEKQNKIVIFVN
ncbi:MAG: hypothetical protein CSA95_05475 [Bacteroidetes bacterium]|nr:MAG: hypothetical protein CSA95_05475 [Bacteroidota bacterium]